jgi:hypothetical protein
MFQFAANGSGNGAGWGQGIRDCNLASGQNTESTAVEFGVAASDRTGRTAQGAYLDNVQITGFGVQLDYESQAWNIQVNHSELINAARHAIWTNPRAINMGESLNWNAVTVANSLGSWMMDAVDIANGSVIGNFIGSNFDNAEVTAAGSRNPPKPTAASNAKRKARNLMPRVLPNLHLFRVAKLVRSLLSTPDQNFIQANEYFNLFL